MAEYEKEFSHLSKYAPELVLTEAFRCREFEDGLNESIKGYLAPVTSLQHVNFYQLVQVAMKVERFEASSRERFQKKRFSKGASSFSGKRVRESQAESVYNSTTKGRRQGPSIALSTGRGASVRPGEASECSHCHQRHLGVCRLLAGGCFRCGSTEHFMVNCPKESRGSRNPHSNYRGRSAAPLLTQDRGRGRAGQSQHKGRGGIVLEMVDCPMLSVPACTYAIIAIMRICYKGSWGPEGTRSYFLYIFSLWY